MTTNSLFGLLYGKGDLKILRFFKKEIFLVDIYVAGTTYIEGIEELKPYLNENNRFCF